MAATNITWNGIPIDDIERNSLSLDRINENGTIREMVDTINANFLNIAKHGGGPAGIDGADGANGVDGANVEYIYALCDEMNSDVQYPTDSYERAYLFNSVKSTGSYTYKGVTWFDNAQPISPEQKNEYVWSRIKRGTGLTEWYYASEPVLWSHWGETGKDGDGVEYIFLASSNELTSISLNTSLLKIENMDDFQKAIFNIDDFYPGKKWFNSGDNKQKARLAISKKGLEISDSTFDTRWKEYFKFCDDTYSWTDEPTGTGPSVLYEYVSIRKSTTDKNDIKTWGNFSTPALWSNYNLPTKTVIIYCNLKEDVTPELPAGGWVDMSTGKLVTNKPGHELTPDYWKDTNDDAEENQITWMSTGVFDHTGKNTYWSYPVRITGKDGKSGEDGTLIEFIYTLTTYGKEPEYPIISDKENLDKLFKDVENSTTSPKYSIYGSTKWYDRAQAISIDNPVEYMAQRSKKPDEKEWTYTEPIIWSHWGEDGTDGDGVEYIFATTKTDSNSSLVLPVYSSLNDSQKKIFQIDDFVPSKKWFDKPKSKQKVQEILGESFDNTEWNNQYGFNVSSGWSDNPVEVGPSVPYQWVSIRRSYADENTGGKRFWEDFSTPVLWNSYGKRSRTFIVYCNMPDETIPESPRLGWWNTSNDTLQISKTDSGEYKSNALSSGTPDYTSYIGYWSDNNIDVRGTITWISTGEFNDSIDENGSNNISWSKPFRITGETGEPGADGSTIEFVYALSDTMPNFPGEESYEQKCSFFESVESAGINGHEYVGTTWYDNPEGITNEDGQRKEWVWSRNKSAGSSSTEWTFPEKPVIWSHWGEDGTDGDGVEYMFLLGKSDAYNLSTEDEWNIFFSSNFTGNNVSDTAKYVYATSDFLPTLDWFNESNSSAIQTRMEADGKTFDATVWNNLKTEIDSIQLGTWKDNPGSVNVSNKYQYVSIRKMSNGVWGAFSYPKLWSKYAIIKFKSIAFAATTIDTDLSGCIVTGGDFSNPLPNLTKKGEQTIEVKWTDGPDPNESEGKTQIWMTSANVSEDSTSALVWSAPQKMTDTADLQVEWSSTDKTLAELASINNSLTQSKYNFGTCLKENNYSENAAELAWRTAMSDDFGISFGDNSENAILMATCQLKNGVWTDWKITRVKGEKGDAGTSVNIKDRIIYESYLTSGTEYNYENANNRRDTHTPDKTPENGDLLIVYPVEPNENGIYYGDASDGGKLYMWKYTNNWEDYNDPNSIGEETGNTYVSPNGHLILWDGDSWGDVGNIVGPEGKSYTIAVKYAKDGENGDKEEITNELEIPNAKWIGTCVYEEGTTIPNITDPSWKWSLFKGQDGYGYEYIFKATSTKDSASIPQVPQMPSGGNWHTTPNIIPDDWTDDPIEPTETDRYIWMCWRKFDHSTQKWTDFMGVGNTTNAKLWHFYVTDGKPGEPGTPGEAGNGYQYKYIRYDNSVNYGSTTCTVTNPSSDEPIFKIGEEIVSSTNSAQGADSGHTYEYRSERYGHTGSWSNWSNPVIIARYLDDSDIQATVQREVQTAKSDIENSINESFKSTTDYVAILKNHINDKGVFSGTLSDDTKNALLDGYIKTNELSGAIEQVKLSGFGVDSETNTARTFSDWINYEDRRFTSVNQELNSLNGTLVTAVNDISKKASSSALTEYQTKADARFAKLENTVANGQFLTDDEGYLLVDELASTTWYSQRTYLGNAGTTTWIMSEVFEESDPSYNLVPEVDSVDDLHNYDYSKWMIILRKPFDFSSDTYSDYTTIDYKTLLSDNITVHLNKNTGEYTIDSIPNDIDNKLDGFYNPFTSSTVGRGIVIYAVVDLNNNSYSTEDPDGSDEIYICSHLSWEVGLSGGYDNLPDIQCSYAYAKTNNIFTIPIYQYKDTIGSLYDDVILHTELYGKYGYTLTVDKNGNVYIPKVAGVSAPVHFVPTTTPFETIWNYFKNGTAQETTEIDDIMLNTYGDYYVLKHFNSILSEPYSYKLDVTDNFKNNDKNVVTFSYDSATTPIFNNTHTYTGAEFIDDNGYRGVTVGDNTSTFVYYLKDSFQFLTTSKTDTINIECNYSCHYRNDTPISVTADYWYDNETTNKKTISLIDDSTIRSEYPALTSVSGYVRNINNEPISGATVRNVGASTTATTDENGHYILGLQGVSGESLLFNYIGMTPIQTTVNGYSEIDVYMSEGIDGYVVKNDAYGSGNDSGYGYYSKTITKNLFDGITIEPYRQLNVEISVEVKPVMNNVDFKYKVETTNKIFDNDNTDISSLAKDYGVNDVTVNVSEVKTDTLIGTGREDVSTDSAQTLFKLLPKYDSGNRQDRQFIFYNIKSNDINLKINLNVALNKGTLQNIDMISECGTFRYAVIPYYFENTAIIAHNIQSQGNSQILDNNIINKYEAIPVQHSSSTILDFNNASENNGEYYFTILLIYDTNNSTTNTGDFYSIIQISPIDWSTDGYTRTINHSNCSNIIDQVRVKISDRSIIEKYNENSRRKALDKNGNPTKNYIDVIDSDRDKLIYSVTELASISQMVSNGIASTSIVTTTEDGGAAIFYEQVDESGSKIYMNANTIGIYSDYFSLDNSGLEMTGNLFAKDKNGIITAGVIGDNTSENDIRFFAGPNYILSPITKQKLILVREQNQTQIFVRYPQLDKISTCAIDYTSTYELWNKGNYDYNNTDEARYKYTSTFKYNGLTYYMWRGMGVNNSNVAVLTDKRDYTEDNLKYYNKDLSLTPKIVAFLKNDEEYTKSDANSTYIVNALNDSIYIDDFYDAYAWVLDRDSADVSLVDYHNGSSENLNTSVVIYTNSENVKTGEIWGSIYTVMDVSQSASESDAIKQSSFKVYEDGSIYANQGYIGTAKITTSGIGVTSDDGFVLIGGNGIKIKDKYDNYSIISPSEITLSAALRKRNAYIFDAWDWDNNGDSKVVQLKKDYNIYPSSEINSAFKECDVINTFNKGNTFTIPSSNSLIGRQITLIGGSALCSMVIKAVEEAGLGYIISMGNEADKFQFSDGCKFYENGGTSSSLKLSNEGVDMIGVGFGNNFKGFVITNRFDISTNYNYGTKFKCLGMFSINGSKIESYTFNGQDGTITSSSKNSVTIKTPFKIANMSEVLVNISGESGNTTGITYNYSLATDSNYILSITVYSSNISKKFKLTVFNFGDFVSLVNDSSEPPTITKKEYSPSNSSTWYNFQSTLWFDYDMNDTYSIRLTVNSAVKKVEYSLQSGSSYFTFTDGSIETPGNTTVPIGKVSTKKYNNTSSYFKGIIKITLHTSTDGTNDKTSIVTIPLEQDYYTQPSYGGGS